MKHDPNALMKQVALFAHDTIENLQREQPDNAKGLAQLLLRGKSRLDARVRDVLGAQPMIDLLIADEKGEHTIATTPMKRPTKQ